MGRQDGRSLSELRTIKIIPNSMPYAEGSVEIQMGETRVICSATVEETVPKWLQSSDQGWVTAEYSMLPRSINPRARRERIAASGRTREISRLIGRSLRASCDLSLLKSRQIVIDCDVIQADGGTRVASITGGFVALALSIKNLMENNIIKENPLKYYVCGVSVILSNDEIIVDPTAEEDQTCSTDMNLVFSSDDRLIEVQGTAEKSPFSPKQLSQIVEQGSQVSRTLFEHQAHILKPWMMLDE